MRWLRWGSNIWAGQTTGTLQGTALLKYFHDPRGKCGSLSNVRLVPDTNHKLFINAPEECYKVLQWSCLKHLWELIIKTCKITNERNQKGFYVEKIKLVKNQIWGEMKSEGEHEEWIWFAAHCKLPCLLWKVAPSWQRGNLILTWNGRKLNGHQNNAVEFSRWVGVLTFFHLPSTVLLFSVYF